MGAQSDDVNISTLSSVTGIASNNLFAHGPSGASSVRMSDFFIDGVGLVEEDGRGPVAKAEWEFITDSSNTIFSLSSTPPGKDDMKIGDQFALAIYPINNVPFEYAVSNYVIGQGMLGGQAWTMSTKKINLLDSGTQTNTGGDVTRIEWKCEVSGYDGVSVTGRWEDGGYNSDMVHYDTAISFIGTSESSEPSVTASDVTEDAQGSFPVSVQAPYLVSDPLDKINHRLELDWSGGTPGSHTVFEGDPEPNNDYSSTGNYIFTVELYNDDTGTKEDEAQSTITIENSGQA